MTEAGNAKPQPWASALARRSRLRNSTEVSNVLGPGVEARKLERDRPETRNQRRKTSIHDPTSMFRLSEVFCRAAASDRKWGLEKRTMPKESECPNMEVGGPRLYVTWLFWTFYHDIWVLRPFGLDLWSNPPFSEPPSHWLHHGLADSGLLKEKAYGDPQYDYGYAFLASAISGSLGKTNPKPSVEPLHLKPTLATTPHLPHINPEHT